MKTEVKIVEVLGSLSEKLDDMKEAIVKLDDMVNKTVGDILNSDIEYLKDNIIPLTKDVVELSHTIATSSLTIRERSLLLDKTKVIFQNLDEIKDLHKGVQSKVDKHWDNISVDVKTRIKLVQLSISKMEKDIENLFLILRRVNALMDRESKGI